MLPCVEVCCSATGFMLVIEKEFQQVFTNKAPSWGTPCVAVCCRVLHCVALCCSVSVSILVIVVIEKELLQLLQLFINKAYSVCSPCVAVCCSVLQCVAVCCSVLQCGSRSHISGPH